MLPGDGSQHGHLLQAIETVQLGLEQVHDAVERGRIGRELHARHVGLGRAEERDLVAQLLPDPHVVG